MRFCTNRIPASVTRTPRHPPAAERSTASVSSCLAIRWRPAPKALRIAISVCRASPRASSRIATLTHASTSRNETETKRTTRKPLNRPIAISFLSTEDGETVRDRPKADGLLSISAHALIECVYRHLFSFGRVGTWTFRLRAWHLGCFLECDCDNGF